MSYFFHPFTAEGLLTLFLLLECIKAVSKKGHQKIDFGFINVSLLFLFCILIHINVDVRYLHVFQNNHPAQAFHYRIASLWSHHQTSLFVWLFLLNAVSYLFLRKNGRTFQETCTIGFRRGLAVLNASFALYLLWEANPFAAAQIEINDQPLGLNPLLYDLNMVWHPPLLYLGQVILFIPYMLGLLASITSDRSKENDLKIRFIQMKLRLSLGVLTAAIALGAIWAFTQLGWGGFWFWDPVEIASLLPWLAALIIIHLPKDIVTARPWLAALPFSFVVLSLWIIRSGVLVSVHSFAEDNAAFWVLGIIYLLVFLPMVFCFFLRSKQKLILKFGFLEIGIGLLTITFILLLSGLFIPILTNINLDSGFFNRSLLPIWVGIALLIILAVLKKKTFTFSISTSLALFLLALFLFFNENLSLPYLIFGGAGVICVGAMIGMCFFQKSNFKAILGHVGVGLAILGISLNTQSSEDTLVLEPNRPLNITTSGFDLTLTYSGITITEDAFVDTHTAHFTMHHNHKPMNQSLEPSRLYFHASKLQRSKASYVYIQGVVYMITSFEQQEGSNQIMIVIHKKQGILWIFIGIVLIAVGFLIRQKNKIIQ